MCVCVLKIAVFGRRKRLKQGICGARPVLGPTQIVGWHHYLWDHLKGGCAQQLLCWNPRVCVQTVVNRPNLPHWPKLFGTMQKHHCTKHFPRTNLKFQPRRRNDLWSVAWREIPLLLVMILWLLDLFVSFAPYNLFFPRPSSQQQTLYQSYHPATPMVARSKQAALRLPLVVCLLCLNYGGDQLVGHPQSTTNDVKCWMDTNGMPSMDEMMNGQLTAGSCDHVIM